MKKTEREREREMKKKKRGWRENEKDGFRSK